MAADLIPAKAHFPAKYMLQTIPTAEPFLYPGNKTGILLIHGFTGTPKEMHWMGEYLSRRGYTTLGIRLTGHATRPEDMIRSRWQDWLASVEDGYHLLRSCTDRIFLAGLSMGAVLSLTFASRLSDLPDSGGLGGVISMSAPFALPPDWRLNLIPIMSWFMPYLPKSDNQPGSGWFGDAWKQHVSYPQNPVRSIGELNHLLAEMRSGLPRIRIPVLIIHSRDDTYVLRDSPVKIQSCLGSPDKQLAWIEGCGHVITEEPKRQEVFKLAEDFVRRVEKEKRIP